MKITEDNRKHLQTIDSIEERFEYLQSVVTDDTVYLVSCGPSLESLDKEYIKEKLKDKFVICAKQALNYLNDICDIHLVSTYNFQPYDYQNKGTIRSWQLTASNMENELNRIVGEYQHEIDLYFPVISGPWLTLEGSTAYTRNFDNWKKLKQEVSVIWGPGILYESGFPMCYMLGFKKIVTIGWDIGDLSRYNNNERDPNWIEQHAQSLYKNNNMGKGPSYTELKNTIECTTAMYDWFVKEGIEVNILSSLNPADDRFKRIEVEDL
tara:strand:+ start:1984 stop:2781 length:798 start_codon:yes stop_codon:yes gene_type:complete